MRSHKPPSDQPCDQADALARTPARTHAYHLKLLANGPGTQCVNVRGLCRCRPDRETERGKCSSPTSPLWHQHARTLNIFINRRQISEPVQAPDPWQEDEKCDCVAESWLLPRNNKTFRSRRTYILPCRANDTIQCI